MKNVYRISSDAKEQVTVLVCAAANGEFENPLVIFPGQRTPKFNFGNIDPNKYSLGHSSNGWMTANVFFTWLSSIFFPSVRDKVRFPILIFLDGHTSHINLAVADFCRENNIILYCFPAHASHVLQPLDVSVFGPLKKRWNKSIDDFRLVHKMSITRSHFFQIFDPAWETTIGLPTNVTSGFRTCGLIPFNVNSVSFNKLLDKVAKERFKEQQKRENIVSQASTYERLGAFKLFQLFEDRLSPAMIERFQTRIDEGYDIEDDTPMGTLWGFYKDAKQFLRNRKVSTPQAVINTSLSEEQNLLQHSEQTLAMSSNVATFLPSSSVSPPNYSLSADLRIQTTSSVNLLCSPSHNPPVCSSLPDPLIHTTTIDQSYLSSAAGPSSCASDSGLSTISISTYNACPTSPFKSYRIISDKISNVKKSSMKPKTPPSFTGKDFHEYLKRTQQEKEKVEQEKEQRKKDREKKREMKEKANKENKRGTKRKPENTDDEDNEDDDELITYVESDSEIEGDFEKKCGACYGENGLDDPARWIGCNRCPRWYHKGCLSEEIEQMSSEEI